MRRLTPLFAALLLLVAVAAGPLFPLVDRVLNGTHASPPWLLGERALSLHDSLWVADLHTDALLWNRGLLERSTRGHVDLPRLLEGGVDLEVFSVTTRYHVASNYRRTPALFDLITPVAIARGWPRATWFDAHQRALFQARSLAAAAQASGGTLRIVRSGPDLDSLTADQRRGRRVVGGILSLEGLHAAGHRAGAVDSLFAAGFRVFGITHMFDNDAGGSAHGWRAGGLTDFGRATVARLDSLGAIIDLAHASERTIDDVLATTSRPVMISHTGVTGTCPGPRNVPDALLRRVGERGGLIGVGFWDRAVCGRDAGAIARAIRHAADVAGVEHVALGSDFDGAVRVPFDATGLALVTEALLAGGMSPDDVARVMGENARVFFARALPPAGAKAR